MAKQLRHGLGMEHETAPAFQNDDGWALIDVDAFNKRPEEPKAWNALSQTLFLSVPGAPPAGRPCKVPKSAFSPLESTRLLFVDGTEVVEDEQSTRYRRPRTSTHARRHDEACNDVMERLAAFAKRRSWKAFQAELLVGQWTMNMTVRKGRLSLSAFAAALRRATAQLFREDEDGPGRFELDSGFVEVKSLKHKNATIASIAAELRARERDVLKRAAELAPPGTRVALLPRAQVVADGTNTYAGSFHVWITLPHAVGPAFDHAAFVRDHARLVHSMQALEPLLLACMPMDPRAPGSGNRYSRSSMRSRLNWLSGFAASNMPAAPQPRKVLCYESLASLNAGDDPVVVRTSVVEATTKSGARINLLACEGQGRTRPGRDTWNSGSGVAYQMMGTDFRYDTCFGCRAGEDPAFYKLGDGAVGVAVQDKGGVFRAKPLACEPRVTGVEFRVFDHMKIEHEHLLGIVVLVAAAGRAETNPDKDGAWIEQMARCARYGSRVPVSAAYWKVARKALGLGASSVPPNAFEALNALLKDAFQKHCKTPTARAFELKDCPVVPDVNFEAWMASVGAMTRLDDALRAKLAKVAREPDALVKVLGAGWKPDLHSIVAGFGAENRNRSV